MSDFYTMLTDIGRASVANAHITGDVVKITHIAVGDGADIPTQSQTSLQNEVWRGEIVNLVASNSDITVLEIHGRVPPEEGGFTIREAGLFDEDGNLFAIAKLPESYKPVLASGSGVDYLLKLVLQTENADHITIKIDPAIIMATRDWVEDEFVIRDLEIISLHMSGASQALQSDLRETEVEHLFAKMKTQHKLDINAAVIRNNRVERIVQNSVLGEITSMFENASSALKLDRTAQITAANNDAIERLLSGFNALKTSQLALNLTAARKG